MRSLYRLKAFVRDRDTSYFKIRYSATKDKDWRALNRGANGEFCFNE